MRLDYPWRHKQAEVPVRGQPCLAVAGSARSAGQITGPSEGVQDPARKTWRVSFGGNIVRVQPSKSIVLTAVLTSLALTMLVACGQFFPSASQIVALQISPLNTVIMPAATQQYTATATYGNNTTGDATSTVTWSSSTANIATIATTGLATAGTTLGTTTITAKSGSVIASTGLTVSNQTVTSLTVSPSSVSLTAGSTQQLTATANLSNNGTSNVTSSATWSSSNTAVATVSGGLVTGVATGTATITATYGGQSASATASVQ